MLRPYFYSPLCLGIATFLLLVFITQAAQSQALGDIPPDVKFEIIKSHKVPGIKLSLDIRLNRRVSESTLNSLAQKLRGSYSEDYKRVFIVYYLPEMVVDAGGWATTHFNPDLKINILGTSADDENTLLKMKFPSKGIIIGRWKDEISIFQLEASGDIYSLHQYFADGTSRDFTLKEFTNRGIKRLVEINEDGTKGEYAYSIKKNGDLSLYEGIRIVRTYKALPVSERTNDKNASGAESSIRTWTDITGRFTVTARYVSSDAKMVRLMKKGGKIVTVPIAKLGVEDRKYVGSKKAPVPKKRLGEEDLSLVQDSGPRDDVSEIDTHILCDKFNIVTNVKGSTLYVSVDTDLPRNTVVFVSVSRSYWEKGNPDEYSIDYFSEKNSIGNWKQSHKISINNKKWKSTLRAKQEEMSRAGFGFDVSSISNKISVRMVVPLNQPDPRFGERNSKLTGKAVSATGLPTVDSEIEIDYPLDSILLEHSHFVSLNPLKLEIGQSYSISKQTPLMPFHSPTDPMAAIQQMKQIPKGGVFLVLEQFKKKTTPWYKVNALDHRRKEIGSGWINSRSLLGQELKSQR